MKQTYAILAFLMVGIAVGPAAGQTGVSDDRVSLPEGPGSLEGVGENVGINPNMGAMTYNIPLDVPQGFALTPSFSLSYNSNGGSGIVGIGWDLDIGHIERMTYRRLPQYNADDDFSVGGFDQLIRLPGTNPPQYRPRYEGRFARYTWMSVGDGSEGYWIGELGGNDGGIRMYFGADADGNLVPEARVSGPDGTFRYMLVEEVDVYDHRMKLSYIKDGNISLIDRIGYVFDDNDQATYEMAFHYEERRDESRVAYLSDAKAGFDMLLTQRLSRVDVLSRNQVIRSYDLTYESYTAAEGFTRLARVERKGVDGSVYPVEFDFSYTQGLQQEPVVFDMGDLGVNIGSGRATLIDINGDALPDLVDSTNDDAHRFFINRPTTDGNSRFEEDPVLSQVGTGSAFRLQLASARVENV
ncbi:MAG: SpvB/TcaC N-terminal domain-containing protein [Myxococcota bacterium]